MTTETGPALQKFVPHAPRHITKQDEHGRNLRLCSGEVRRQPEFPATRRRNDCVECWSIYGGY